MFCNQFLNTNIINHYYPAHGINSWYLPLKKARLQCFKYWVGWQDAENVQGTKTIVKDICVFGFALKENIREEGPTVRPSWFSFLAGNFKPIYLNLSFLLYEPNVATATSSLWSLNQVPSTVTETEEGQILNWCKALPTFSYKTDQRLHFTRLPSGYFENNLTELTSTLESSTPAGQLTFWKERTQTWSINTHCSIEKKCKDVSWLSGGNKKSETPFAYWKKLGKKTSNNRIMWGSSSEAKDVTG